jgi:hypothetical protein
MATLLINQLKGNRSVGGDFYHFTPWIFNRRIFVDLSAT